MYTPDSNRYSEMRYSYCGKSGLKLPKISLGMWHNFGGVDDYQHCKEMIHYAFDHGITHFDLANNYGPPPGSAEECFGRIMDESLRPYRDEIIVSTKAGHEMWQGPYGDNSSRKNLMASLDQSLGRMKLDYVDIFYSHRYDGVTPLEETIQALIDIVKSGKALYAGISKYPPALARQAYRMMEAQGIHCLIHQDRYNLLTRNVEKESLQTAAEGGVGFIAFSPLAQGLLSDKYLHGIPQHSRAASASVFLKPEDITPERRALLCRLNDFAQERGESLAQLALNWLFSNPLVCSVIVGASSTSQLNNNLSSLSLPELTPEDYTQINRLLNESSLSS